jgi:hypothetical protein
VGHCQGRHLYHAAVRVFRLAAHTQGADVAPYASGLGGRDAQDAQPKHLSPTCNGLQPGVALGSGGVMVDAYTSRENGASLNPRNFPLRGLYRKGATNHTPPGIPISQPISGHTGYLTTMICYEMSQLLVVTLVQFPRITAALLVKRLRVSPRVAGVVNMTSPALYHPFFSMRDMTRTV